MDKTSLEKIRESARTMVRELGMLGEAHADLGVTNSQVHALIELDRHQKLSVIEIARLLRLEKSSVSRLVEELKTKRLITVVSDSKDKRRKVISLTSTGSAKLKLIHQEANTRVAAAMKTLTAKEQQQVFKGLELYAQALTISRETA